MLFLLNLSRCVKSYGHICQIYQNHSPDMVMSRNPGLKFRKFYFRKSYQICGKLDQEKNVTGRKQVGGGNYPPPPLPVLIGLNVIILHVII